MITQPSPGLAMKQPGLYEISGIAWSGYGKIAKVEVSADGGKSWAVAALQAGAVEALTRFACRGAGMAGPAVLQPRHRRYRPSSPPAKADRQARHLLGLSLQCDHHLGRVGQGRGEVCLRVTPCSTRPAWPRSRLSAAGRWRDARTSDAPTADEVAAWISASVRMAPAAGGQRHAQAGEAVCAAKCLACTARSAAAERRAGRRAVARFRRCPRSRRSQSWPCPPRSSTYVRRAMPYTSRNR